MNTSTNPTAHTDLTHIATQWPTLRELLTATTQAGWPPVMGIANLERDEADQAEAAAERAERTALAPGERPIPLRAAILDTITALDHALLGLADEIASSVQRPAFTIRGASPLDTVARSVAMMGAKDAADPRRWRFNLAHRDGAVAAAWLADRLTGPDGPFRALSLAQQDQVAKVAARARHRLDRALGERTAGTETELDLTCGCGGRLIVTTGDIDFAIRCAACAIVFTGTSLLDGLTITS